MKEYIALSPERRKVSWVNEWIRKQKSDPELKQLDQNQRLNKKSNVLTVHIRPVVDFTRNEYGDIVKIQVGTEGCKASHIIDRQIKWLSDCYSNTLRRYLEEKGVIRRYANNNNRPEITSTPHSKSKSKSKSNTNTKLKSNTNKYRNGLKQFLNGV